MGEREECRANGQCEPISDYTEAMRFGDLVFVSGLAPRGETGYLVRGDDVAERTRFAEEIRKGSHRAEVAIR